MSRIVLLGATGYTGSRTLKCLAAEQPGPVLLVGRNEAGMRDRALDTGVDCEVVVADVTAPGALDAVLRADDVVVSTVGPFLRVGREVARSAARSGSVYLDSTGEPSFIAWVFRTLGSVASRTGALLIPAFGYDFVPGHVAAATVLDAAGPAATGVQLGYFLAPGLPGEPGGERMPSLSELRALTTPGTRASLTGVIAEPSFAFRRNPADAFGLETQGSGEQLLHFDIAGVRRAALTIGGSEHFGLPEAFPRLRAVDVGLGWFGPITTGVHRLSNIAGPAMRSRAAVAATQWLSQRLPWQDAMPSIPGRSLVAARALDSSGAVLASVVLEGPAPYEFTARLMARAAAEFARQRPGPGGVHGPLLVAGSAGLRTLAESAFLRQVDPTTLRPLCAQDLP